MVGGHQGGVLADAAHQHPRKEEVGEHHDAAKAEPHGVAQARLHQGKGDP